MSRKAVQRVVETIRIVQQAVRCLMIKEENDECFE